MIHRMTIFVRSSSAHCVSCGLCPATLLLYFDYFRMPLPYSKKPPNRSYELTSPCFSSPQTDDRQADWDLAMKLRAYSLSLSILVASLVSAQTIQEIVRIS